jgi:hypothetical protein
MPVIGITSKEHTIQRKRKINMLWIAAEGAMNVSEGLYVHYTVDAE